MKQKKKKTRQTVWAYETMDPKVLWWLDQHEREVVTDANGKSSRVSRLKPGVDRFKLQQVEAEIYEAIKKLARSTLQAYKKCKRDDLEKMIDDLTSSVMMTFRTYFDPDKGKIFTLLVFIIKTQYSHYYKGIFPSSSFYNTNKHEKLELKRVRADNDEDLELLLQELQYEAERLGPDHSVRKSGRQVILEVSTKHFVGELSPVVAQRSTERQFSEFDAIDCKAIEQYVPDVVAAPKHHKVAFALLEHASELVSGETSAGGNKQMLPWLRRVCAEALDEPVSISDVKLGIRVVRVARQYLLEEETAYTSNYEEDFLLQEIDGGW